MRYIPIFLTAAFFVGCVSTEATMLDSAPPDRPDVTTSQVVVYSDTNSIDCPYDRVALVKATGGSSDISNDKIIKKTKKKAAEVRANTIIIGDLSTDEADPNQQYDFGGREGRFSAIYEHRPCN